MTIHFSLEKNTYVSGKYPEGASLPEVSKFYWRKFYIEDGILPAGVRDGEIGSTVSVYEMQLIDALKD